MLKSEKEDLSSVSCCANYYLYINKFITDRCLCHNITAITQLLLDFNMKGLDVSLVIKSMTGIAFVWLRSISIFLLVYAYIYIYFVLGYLFAPPCVQSASLMLPVGYVVHIYPFVRWTLSPFGVG